MFGKKRTKTPIIGIDIGTSYIKIAQFKEEKDKIKLVNFAFLPTPVESIRDGKIVKEDELAEVISSLMAFHGFQGKRVAAAVSGQAVTVKQITVEEIPKQEISEILKWELDKYVSYPTDQAVFDYQILAIDEKQKDKKKYKCLIAVAPLEVLTPLLSTLKKAKLEPFYFEADSFSELRLADFLTEKNEELNNSILVFVNIGVKNTMVEVTDGASIILTRIMPMGINFLKEGILEKMDASLEEAENAILNLVNLEEGAFFDEAEKKATDLIIPKLEELTLEIKRSLSFFNTRFGEKNEKPIYLVFSGGGAGIKGLVPYMEANTGISSIRNQYVLQLCEYDKAQFKETYLQTMAPIFSIASGLALLDIEERYMRKAAKVLAEKRKAEEKNFENGIKKIEKSEIIDENKVIS